jgi:hypothetical protein
MNGNGSKRGCRTTAYKRLGLFGKSFIRHGCWLMFLLLLLLLLLLMMNNRSTTTTKKYAPLCVF